MGSDQPEAGAVFGGCPGMVSGVLERLHRRLQEKVDDVCARPATYVAFGDSVTQGCMQAGVFEYGNVYHAVARRALEQRFYGTVVNVINSGVAGDNAAASRVRWDRDIFQYQPDLVTIMFGHNDAHAGEAGLDGFIGAIDELVGRLRGETEADIVLITPCMMMKRDNEQISAENKHHVPGFLRLAEAGSLERYVQRLRQYAEENAVLLVDAYAMWEAMEASGADIHACLSNGINHPDTAFHIELGQALGTALCRTGREEL